MVRAALAAPVERTQPQYVPVIGTFRSGLREPPMSVTGIDCYKARMIHARRPMQPGTRSICRGCCMEPGCWPNGAPAPQALPIERIPALAKSMVLWRPGDAYAGSYLVRSGALKIVAVDAAGDEQVLQFALPGDLIGFEAMARGRHDSLAVALQDSGLCRLLWPLPGDATDPPLQLLLRASSTLQQRFGAGRHGEPLPAIRAFVHALAQRIGREERRGAARIIRVQLPMGRLEIGQFLGYSEETVCRCLRRLHDLGEMIVRGRAVLVPAAPGCITGAVAGISP